MTATKEQWKVALNSKEAFHDFITNYFMAHKKLKGNYDNQYYFENYAVSLDSKKGLVVTLTTGSYTGTGFPIKDVEHISIEDFRQLLLNKKFADKNVTLPQVFNIAAYMIA